MTASDIDAWTDVAERLDLGILERQILGDVLVTCHDIGIGPDAFERLARHTPKVNQLTLIPKVARQMRFAGLDPQFLYLWVAAFGADMVVVDPNLRRSTRAATKKWVGLACKYVAACHNDVELAALAAAAGLTPNETRNQYEAGELTVAALETMTVLRRPAV